jgi:hypothetical protein
VHGGIAGAFKTSLTEAITKLKLTSKGMLLSGTNESSIALLELYEPKVFTINNKDTANTFDQLVNHVKIMEAAKSFEGDEIMFSASFFDTF